MLVYIHVFTRIDTTFEDVLNLLMTHFDRIEVFEKVLQAENAFQDGRIVVLFRQASCTECREGKRDETSFSSSLYHAQQQVIVRSRMVRCVEAVDFL